MLLRILSLWSIIYPTPSDFWRHNDFHEKLNFTNVSNSMKMNWRILCYYENSNHILQFHTKDFGWNLFYSDVMNNWIWILWDAWDVTTVTGKTRPCGQMVRIPEAISWNFSDWSNLFRTSFLFKANGYNVFEVCL